MKTMKRKMYTPPKDTKGLAMREFVVAVFFSVLFTAIAGRGVYLQIFQREWLAEQAKS